MPGKQAGVTGALKINALFHFARVYPQGCPRRVGMSAAPLPAGTEMVSSYTMGGFIHILWVIAVVVILVRLIPGRRL